jgi:hypothetical protein
MLEQQNWLAALAVQRLMQLRGQIHALLMAQ